jgi:adenylate cyclase
VKDNPRMHCVLFASVCGSSRLYEKLGDTEAMYAVERCLKRMERATVAFKGRVVKAIGDEIMVLFESTDEALLAACEMQQRVVDLPPVSGIKLSIRCGFAQGEITADEDDVTGEAVDVAAQVSGMAQPGQILTTHAAAQSLSQPLRQLTRDEGIRNELRIAEVVWQSSTEQVRRPAKTMVAEAPKTSLRLRHGGRELAVRHDGTALTLGRDANNDLVIGDPRASRNHGRIEPRLNQFFVVDQSTNGTYVLIEGEAEFMLKGDESVLHGRGKLSFGHPYGEDRNDEFVEFELMR